jgi:ParB-like chromosome segregation protein Spo0J
MGRDVGLQEVWRAVIASHPLAALIPPMSAEEFTKLVQDIAQNGLMEPITTFEGKILDGRHRYAACRQAGVAPRFTEFAGPDPVAFVLSKNLHRRHLTAAQKAAIAAEALPLLEERERERQRAAAEVTNLKLGRKTNEETLPQKIAEAFSEAREQAAQLTGSNRQYVSDAKKIREQAPEVFEAMKAGAVSVPEAKALAAQPETERAQMLSVLPVMSREERRALFRIVPPPRLGSQSRLPHLGFVVPLRILERLAAAVLVL